MNNLECTTLTFGNMQWYVSGQVGVGTKCIIKQRMDSWKCTKNEIELLQKKRPDKKKQPRMLKKHWLQNYLHS